MVTIFICKDDAVSKEITQKYLDRESLSYVNMLDGITYEQAVRAIEGLEKCAEAESEGIDEIYAEKTMEEEGWTPIAITEECLKPSESELWILVGYSRPRNAGGTETELSSEMRLFKIKDLKKFIKQWKLTPIDEATFNIMFKN